MKKLISVILCVSIFVCMAVMSDITAFASTETTLVLNQETEILIKGYNSAILYFTPEVDGYYTLKSFSEGIDPYAEIYKMVDDSDLYMDGADDGGDGNDFVLTTYLEAGQPYSYRTNYFDSEDGLSYTVVLTLESGTDDSILGDVDGDSNVTIMDATAIQRHIAKHLSLTEKQLEVADTDKDGKLSVMDATAIQRYVAKLIDKF